MKDYIITKPYAQTNAARRQRIEASRGKPGKFNAESARLLVQAARDNMEFKWKLYADAIEFGDLKLAKTRGIEAQKAEQIYDKLAMQYGYADDQDQECTCDERPNTQSMACGVCRRRTATSGIPFSEATK